MRREDYTMIDKIRVVWYLNQFFGQIGGEDKADIPPQKHEGGIGPAAGAGRLLGDRAEVVGTVICGDTYFGENVDVASDKVVELIASFNPSIVIAGPAFNAGRYGVACGAVAKAVSEKLNIPVISGMYPENPGVDMYKKYAYMVETTNSAAGMRKALPAIIKLALKVGSGEPMGTPKEEGYMARGVRVNVFAEERGSKRAVNMLMKKLRGEEFVTEYPMPNFDRVAPNPPVADLSKAKIALVTSGGIVPKHNPDHIESSSASKYGKYDIANFNELTEADHETAHGGYDPTYANTNPDRVLPVDVLRDMEKEGLIGELHRYFYTTVGNGTAVASSKKFAETFSKELIADGVDAVILTST
jgi:glycine reductase complex component B subunit gamma